MGPERPEPSEVPEVLVLSLALPVRSAIEEMLLKRLGYGINRNAPPQIHALCASAIKHLLAAIKPRAIIAFTSVTDISKEAIHTRGMKIESPLWADLAQRSGHPVTIALFALTLGPLPEPVSDIERAMHLSDRYVFHEAASQIIETLADDLSKKIEHHKRVQGRHALYRFSPGYCDIPLSAQALFFNFLNPAAIGIRLCASGAMLPSKSITAAILFAPSPPALSPCMQCKNQWCRHRRC